MHIQITPKFSLYRRDHLPFLAFLIPHKYRYALHHYRLVGQEATVRTRHGTMDWFQMGKEYAKAIYCHCAYLIYMQSISIETLGLEEAQAEIKIARRDINNLRSVDDTILMMESEEELKSLFR